MDQRNNAPFVPLTPAPGGSLRTPSHKTARLYAGARPRRARRRPPAGRNGLLLAAASLGVLGGVALTRGVLHSFPQARDAPARAEAAAPTAPAPSATAMTLSSAPVSWDYRWLSTHPATGAPANRSLSAVMVDLSSGHVLFSRDPHRRVPPASTAKLMTAMVAIDDADPATVVTVPAAAAQVEPDVMGLGAGERVSVHDLLLGLLLDSGNDAAETLATTTGTGRDAFIAQMNQRAAAMGLTDTHFANPSGLDDLEQLTSANDLSQVAAYLYSHYPVLAAITATKSASIEGTQDHKAFAPTNFNKLLWTYPGAVGFKTGLTDAAGTCLVAGAHRGDHTLLIVEMNDPLIFTDASAMFDYGFRRVS